MAHFIPTHIKIEKRIFDIVLAIILLIVTLPLIPIIALVIKWDSKGDIFFSQCRVGEIAQDKVSLFSMFKFRTMRSDAEAAGPQLATENDDRTTRIGKFLRKTRLDEIPQLINVLKGDMSFIGPRPERPFFYCRNERAIPFFAERTYGIKPGITGIAQVNQGYDATIEDVKNKVSYDHAYAVALTSTANWMIMDIMILCKTVSVVLLGRGR